jgi:predicted SAM-dependent methyltransferase
VKIHLGCGDHVLNGWFNTDLAPVVGGVMALDVTKTFPVADNSVEYIFTEHLIEHIGYPEGMFMLRECYRVLVPGGRIRITTPDLNFLFALFDGGEVAEKYMEWATQQFLPWAPYVSPVMVLNNFVRAWGHQFIYDDHTLRTAMMAAGFRVGPEQQLLGESSCPELRGLENVGRMPPGMLQLESFTLEGEKCE